jgi:hypothetical protein
MKKSMNTPYVSVIALFMVLNTMPLHPMETEEGVRNQHNIYFTLDSREYCSTSADPDASEDPEIIPLELKELYDASHVRKRARKEVTESTCSSKKKKPDPAEIAQQQEQAFLDMLNQKNKITRQIPNSCFAIAYYKCNAPCTSTFPYVKDLRDHMMNAHSNAIQPCPHPHCEKTFSEQAAAMHHRRSHSLWPCQRCDKVLETYRNYKQHQRDNGHD